MVLISPISTKIRSQQIKIVTILTSNNQVQLISTAIGSIIFLLFLDSANKVFRNDQAKYQRYQQRHDPMIPDNDKVYLKDDFKVSNLYAQRNLYLTGFTLFLGFVELVTFFIIVKLNKHQLQLVNLEIDGKKSAKNQINESQELVKLQGHLKDVEMQIRDVTAQYKNMGKSFDFLVEKLNKKKAATSNDDDVNENIIGTGSGSGTSSQGNGGALNRRKKVSSD